LPKLGCNITHIGDDDRGSPEHTERPIFKGSAACAGPHLWPSRAQLLHVGDCEKRPVGNGRSRTRALAFAAQWTRFCRTHRQSKSTIGRTVALLFSKNCKASFLKPWL